MNESEQLSEDRETRLDTTQHGGENKLNGLEMLHKTERNTDKKATDSEPLLSISPQASIFDTLFSSIVSTLLLAIL